MSVPRLLTLPLAFALAACTSTSTANKSPFNPNHSAPATSVTSRPAPVERRSVDPGSFDPDNPVIPGFVPRAVVFLDEEHGVIGGKVACPKRCEGRHDGILAATHDGGTTWRLTVRTDTPITNLTSLAATATVWATASECAYFFYDCGRRLLRSVDGGVSWTDRTSWVVNPSFVTPEVGFGAGRLQSTSTTTDGGRTWHLRRGPCNGYQDMPVGFSFTSSEVGWAACASSEPGAGFFQFKAVYRTTDGGSSWTPTASFDPDHNFGRGLWANGGALGIQMFADGTGYFWAGGGFAYLVRTSDGGHTWRTVWQDPGGGAQEFSSISWLTADEAYGVRWKSSFGWTLLRTVDGGSRWESLARWPSHE
jgi:photosystem II stability/assembly factor-like uncharacterized protein